MRFSWVLLTVFRDQPPGAADPETDMPHSDHARVSRLRPCRLRTQEPPRRVAQGRRPRARRLRPPHLRRPGRLPAVLPPRRGAHGRGPGQPRHRDRRLRQRRADRREQGQGRTRRAGLERGDRRARPRAQQRQRRRRRRAGCTRRTRRRSSSRSSSPPRSRARSATPAASTCSSAYETTGELPPIPAHHPQQADPPRSTALGRGAGSRPRATGRRAQPGGTADPPRTKEHRARGAHDPPPGRRTTPRAFAGRAGPGQQPAGQVRRQRGPPRRRGSSTARRGPRQAPLPRLRRDAGWIHIHLGLFGKVGFGDAPAPPPTDTVRLRLANEHRVRRPARPHHLRPDHRRREAGDTRPPRPRPAAPGRRPATGLRRGSPAAVRRSPPC